MHEIESKSPCCNAPMSLCRCPEAEKHCMKCGRIVTPNPEPPENDGEKGKSQTRGKTVSGKSWETTVQHVVTDLEEDRKFLDRWKKDETTGGLHDLIDRLLAAKERVVGAACAEELMAHYGDGQDAIVIISNDDNKPTQRPGLQELIALLNPPPKMKEPKKETLKDWVKGYSVKSVINLVFQAGMNYQADPGSAETCQHIKRIMVNEINRRIRNAKKL